MRRIVGQATLSMLAKRQLSDVTMTELVTKMFQTFVEMSAGIDPKVFAAYFNRIGFNAYRLIHHQLTGRDIILPDMPGTRHCHSMELPLPEWPSAMQAGIMDGVEFIPDIRNGQR